MKVYMKIFSYVFLIIFLTGSISALAWDEWNNEKEIKINSTTSKYGVIEINNWFGYGGKLAEYELTENTDICGIECYARGTATIYEKEKLFDNINFIDLRVGGNKQIGHEIFLIEKYNLTVPDIKYNCVMSKNGTTSCTENIIGTREVENERYIKYNGETLLGTYEWLIKGNKKSSESVDWIVEIQGVSLTEWANWEGAKRLIHNDTLTSSTGWVNEGNATSAIFNASGLFLDSDRVWKNFTNLRNLSETWFIFESRGATYVHSANFLNNSFGLSYDQNNFGIFNGTTSNNTGSIYGAGGGITYNKVQINGTLAEAWFDKNSFDNINTSAPANVSTTFDIRGTDINQIKFKVNSAFGDANIKDLLIYSIAATNILLSSPADNSLGLDSTVTLIGNASAETGTTINNVSLWHNGTGTFARNQTNTTISSNSTQVFFNTTLDGDLLWNMEVCDSNDQCVFGITNRTILKRAFIENSQIFNTTTHETGTESFTLNISSNGSITSAKLFYNGSDLGAGTKFGDNVQARFEKTIQVDLVDNSTIKEFYWEITSGSTLENSSFNNQTINQTTFNLCNATNNIPYYNVTFKDESDQSSIYASIPTSTFNYWLGDGSVNKTLTFTNNTANPNYNFCFTPQHKTVNVDSIIQYENTTNYPQRIYDPSTISLTNQTTNQTLYLLATVDGIYVTFQVLDALGNALSGVDTNGTRVIGGSTSLVASGTTDAAGAITFWLNPDFSHTFTFIKLGYGSLTTAITPTQSAYTVTLGGTTQAAVTDYLREILINIFPRTQYLTNHTDYSFNYSLSTSYWTLDSFGFALKHGNGTLIGTQSSSSSTGGTLSLTGNTANSTRIIMDYYYIVNSTTINKTKVWQVSTPGNYGISFFFERTVTYIDANMFGILGKSGTDYFGKALISVLILVLVTGTLSARYGIASETAVMGIIFGLVMFLNNMNMIPNPDFLTSSAVSLGDFLVYLVGVMIIGFIIKEEYR